MGEWVAWNGGECPVPAGTKVWIKLRGEFRRFSTTKPEAYCWDVDGGRCEITEFRIDGRQGDPNAHESVRKRVVIDDAGRMVKEADEKPVEWDGVGVPAAGTLIEVLPNMQHCSSRNVVVVGFDSTLKRVVFRDLDWSDLEYDSALLESVRPIRSERDKAVEEMLNGFTIAHSEPDGIAHDYYTLSVMAEWIYDAGYRKAERE